MPHPSADWSLHGLAASGAVWMALAVALATVAGAAALWAWRLHAANRRLRCALSDGDVREQELVAALESRIAAVQADAAGLQKSTAELDRLVRTDRLTGVTNRRGLTEALDRAWRAGQRQQLPLSLLMVDIDHFRAFNDSHGRPRGDACLQAVANALRQVAGRATDTVGRIGGEEFVVILGNTPLEGALQLASQLRTAVEALAIPNRGAPAPGFVTVSVGVASVLPAREARYESCLEAADRALGAAKEQGRNRVGYSTPAGASLLRAGSIAPPPGQRLS